MARICTGPQKLDWECAYAGDDVKAVFRFLADGDPWDLTGTTFIAQVRETSLSADPAALTGTVTLIDAVGGTLEVQWDGEAIRTLLGSMETWSGVWDLQMTAPGGDITTMLAGAFMAKMDVSR